VRFLANKFVSDDDVSFVRIVEAKLRKDYNFGDLVPPLQRQHSPGRVQLLFDQRNRVHRRLHQVKLQAPLQLL
jgi:hypothetical protein